MLHVRCEKRIGLYLGLEVVQENRLHSLIVRLLAQRRHLFHGSQAALSLVMLDAGLS